MSELKPCPFCGGEAEVFGETKWSRGAFVGCLKCRATIGRQATEAEAIEAWNTRHERTCRIVEGSRKYVLSDGTELFEGGCSECGGYLEEGDNYCPNCGAKVVE